ncbi:MAG TPA: HlyD family efflux transporter periplasmic adaptor subunit [Planctomycetaceae bacterium]|nr:HlyD family efflux transporter periplasmic adaptor subunit [Planctomycetaceae bacterium]
MTATTRHKRRVVSRYVVPGVIVLGFLGMLAWAARDRFLPARPVTVVPVVVTRADVQRAGTPMFQAAGWVEPRPTPTVVSALAEGVIEELLVVAGQDVQRDEPVARLIDVDARLALERADADRTLRQAELASARAALTAAELRLEHPVHLDAALADAESNSAKVETEFAQIPFLIEASQARLEFAKQEVERQQALEGVSAGRLLQQARSQHASAQAELRDLQQRRPLLERQIAALRRKSAALAKQRELLIDESRQVADTTAQVQAAQARETQAALAVQTARLQLERMTIRSPVAGRVLELVARPGVRVSGLSLHASQDASTVVTLYDPGRLQVRADVRLEDVPLVSPGQPVEIETPSAKAPIRGEVLSITSTASVQKNTLEVKVALDAPPAAVRPEMLVTATFLAPDQPGREAEESERERLLVPRQLVGSDEGGPAVWVADASGTARRQAVRLGRAGTADLVEVVEGLAPTDRLIVGGREGLANGERITITGEDTSVGVADAR